MPLPRVQRRRHPLLSPLLSYLLLRFSWSTLSIAAAPCPRQHGEMVAGSRFYSAMAESDRVKAGADFVFPHDFGGLFQTEFVRHEGETKPMGRPHVVSGTRQRTRDLVKTDPMGPHDSARGLATGPS